MLVDNQKCMYLTSYTKGRLNGPYYQLINTDGSGKMFGHFKNGKRNGLFKKIYWDIECTPYDGVEYNMGEVISIYFVDDVGRYTKTTVENGIAVKCVPTRLNFSNLWRVVRAARTRRKAL